MVVVWEEVEEEEEGRGTFIGRRRFIVFWEESSCLNSLIHFAGLLVMH